MDDDFSQALMTAVVIVAVFFFGVGFVVGAILF